MAVRAVVVQAAGTEVVEAAVVTVGASVVQVGLAATLAAAAAAAAEAAMAPSLRGNQECRRSPRTVQEGWLLCLGGAG